MFAEPIDPDLPAAAARAAFSELYLEHVRSLAAAEERIVDASQRDRVTAYTRSFADMAALLDRVRGRKYVVLLSEGFRGDLLLPAGSDRETSESAESGELWNLDSDKLFGSTRLAGDLQEMLTAFCRADCVIHAVDIGGVRGIDEPGLRQRTAADPQASGLQVQGGEGQDSLFAFARGTGGELFRNYNDLAAAMERVLEATSLTYVLTFDPGDVVADGAFHPVRVALKGGPPRARLTHRPGYYGPRPSLVRSAIEQRLEIADLLFGAGSEGAIGISLAAVALAGGRPAVVPFVAAIDGASLLAGHGESLLTADLYLYAFDAEGGVAASLNQVVGLNLLQVRPALEKAGIRFYGDLEPPPGHYRLRLVARNQQAGTFGLASAGVEVPEDAAGGPPRAGVVMVEPPGEWILLREKPEQLRAPYPFTVSGQFLVPARAAELRPAEIGRLWIEFSGREPAPPELAGRVTTRDGREVGGGPLQVVEAMSVGPATSRLLARFPVPDLPEGEYLLRIAPAEPAGAPALGHLAFSVVK
jgi:VWFA-related protein